MEHLVVVVVVVVLVVVVVVVVVGPYRVFDGGVFANRLFKKLAGAAFSALSATNLPGRPNAFFAANLCLTRSSFELSLPWGGGR